MLRFHQQLRCLQEGHQAVKGPNFRAGSIFDHLAIRKSESCFHDVANAANELLHL
jgi:hypothetical protein